MAKVNVNTANRDELLAVGGLRPEIVDEILKMRRKDKIRSVEALDQVPGVGPVTLEQLKKALDFSDPTASGNGDDRDQERASRGAQEAAREAGEAARGGLRLAQQVVGSAGDVQRDLTQRSAEGTIQLEQALLDLMHQQTRHNMEVWTALAGTIDWDQVLRIQNEYLRLSLERMAELTQRYIEVTQKVVTAAADGARQQAKKAA